MPGSLVGKWAQPVPTEACGQDALELDCDGAASGIAAHAVTWPQCAAPSTTRWTLWERACAGKPSRLSRSSCRTSAVTFPPRSGSAQWRRPPGSRHPCPHSSGHQGTGPAVQDRGQNG